MATQHLVLVLFWLSAMECSVAQALLSSPPAVSFNAVPTPTPPQKRGDRPGSPKAMDTALPAATPAVNASSTVNTPQHSPDQFDFGTVANGSTSKRTFSLTTTASGYVTLSISAGPFRVAEFREIAPLLGGSKRGGAQPAAAATGGVRSRIKYQEGQNGPYQWSMAPNMEIQVDLVFAPMLKRGETPGPRSATMKVNGPGPRGNWSLAIPLTAVLSNLVVTPAPPAAKLASQSASSGKTPSAKNLARKKRERSTDVTIATSLRLESLPSNYQVTVYVVGPKGVPPWADGKQ